MFCLCLGIWTDDVVVGIEYGDALVGFRVCYRGLEERESWAFGNGLQSWLSVLVMTAVKIEVHFPVERHQEFLSCLTVVECGEVKRVSVRDGASVVVVECGLVAELCRGIVFGEPDVQGSAASGERVAADAAVPSCHLDDGLVGVEFAQDVGIDVHAPESAREKCMSVNGLFHSVLRF